MLIHNLSSDIEYFDYFQYVSCMSEPRPEPEVGLVLRRVPGLAERYVDLAEEASGDPGGAVVFEALADLARDLTRAGDGAAARLGELMAAVEEVASTSPDAEELVGGAFLESLSPDDLLRLEALMGRRTRAVLDELELPADALGGGDSPG